MDMTDQSLYCNAAVSTNMVVTVDTSCGSEKVERPRLDAIHSAAMLAAWKTVNHIQKFINVIQTKVSDPENNSMLDGDPGPNMVGSHSYLIDGKPITVEVTMASVGLNLPPAVMLNAVNGILQATPMEMFPPEEMQLLDVFIAAGSPTTSNPLAALMQQHGVTDAVPETNNGPVVATAHSNGAYL